jgi:outer membrane scaffolding protein for murein synthesis (MipA/OmpV family)
MRGVHILRLFLLSLALPVITLTPAQAEDTPPLTTLIGAGIWSRPAYTGADSNRTSLIPELRYYGKPWFVRTTFGMLEGGARYQALSGFTLGGQLAYEGGRDQTESEFLAAHNLPTLNPSLSWGIHAELVKKLGPMPLAALLRYRQDMDNNRGAQTDLRLEAGIFSGGGLNAGIFAQSTRADKKSSNYYYGISTQQSASSGLSAFDAQSGEMFSIYGLFFSYDLNPEWIVLGNIESRQVRGAVSDSPLVQQSSNRYASLGLAYQF